MSFLKNAVLCNRTRKILYFMSLVVAGFCLTLMAYGFEVMFDPSIATSSNGSMLSGLLYDSFIQGLMLITVAIGALLCWIEMGVPAVSKLLSPSHV